MTTANNPGPSQKGQEKDREDRTFECNICLDTAKDAVVSLCGHLFCWPCLHEWLETRPPKKICPVCKAAISEDKVIPLYGKGSTKQSDPRKKVPPRPAGRRTESEMSGTFPGFGFGDSSYHLSLGIGAFPFAIFSSWNFGENRASVSSRAPHEDNDDDQSLVQLFLVITMVFILSLLFA